MKYGPDYGELLVGSELLAQKNIVDNPIHKYLKLEGKEISKAKKNFFLNLILNKQNVFL